MGCMVVGVDPHRRSHTAVALEEDEEIAAQLRVAAVRRQIHRLLAWANGWPQRIWAVQNANGLGRLLSQQLVTAGEQVVDVPASLSHHTRKPSGKSVAATAIGVSARSRCCLASTRPSTARSSRCSD